MHAQKAPAGLRARLRVHVRAYAYAGGRANPSRAETVSLGFPGFLPRAPGVFRVFRRGGPPRVGVLPRRAGFLREFPRPRHRFPGFPARSRPGFRAFQSARADPGSGAHPGRASAPRHTRVSPAPAPAHPVPPAPTPQPAGFPGPPGKTAGAFAPPRPGLCLRAARGRRAPGPPGFSHFATRKSAL